MKMTDGYNQQRAMRVAEIMEDFRNVMTYIAQVNAQPSATEANEEGFVLLQRCKTEARALLAQPFQGPGEMNGTDEQQKVLLKRIIIDASVRRFKAQKIYLRVTVALRWVNSRAAILQGQNPGPQHARMLSQITQNMRSDLNSVSDQRVFQVLRATDENNDRWLAEDPSLQEITRLIAN